jgi:hypothetical protein
MKRTLGKNNKNISGSEECKIIISPLLRYIGSKCCENPVHISNFCYKWYFEKLGIGLGEVTDWVKELGHSKRIKNYKVMCPNRLLKMGEDDERAAKRVRTYWDADPVHMCSDGYLHLAKALLDKVAVVAEQAAEEKLLEQQHAGHSSKKKHTGRPGWTDDAVAR